MTLSPGYELRPRGRCSSPRHRRERKQCIKGMASQKLATSLMDKGFIRKIRAKPDRARGLFGSKAWPMKCMKWQHPIADLAASGSGPHCERIHKLLTQTMASRLPPDRPRLNLKASLDPSDRNQDSAIALLRWATEIVSEGTIPLPADWVTSRSKGGNHQP